MQNSMGRFGFTFSTCKFVQKIHLALRFCLINLTTGYSQRLEASDFSSLIYTKNNFGTKSTLQFFIWHALREFPTICLRVLCMLWVLWVLVILVVLNYEEKVRWFCLMEAAVGACYTKIGVLLKLFYVVVFLHLCWSN